MFPVRPGVWRVDIELPRDKVTGKRRRVSRYSLGSVEQSRCEITRKTPTTRTSHTRERGALEPDSSLAGGGVSGQPLKPGTVQRVHVVLRAALAQAMRWDWIWDNPAEHAHRITVVSCEPEPPHLVSLSFCSITCANESRRSTSLWCSEQ